MSNTNNNLQTQTSNAFHNAIMEVCCKDLPPMLAPSNYVQWKSRIKIYIDTKPNNELIHYCLQNLLYKFEWTEKTVLVAKGSSKTTTEGYMENYKNVSQDIWDQLNAESVKIILTGIDNDIYSTVDAFLMHVKFVKPLKDSTMVTEDDEMSKKKEIDKLMALISLLFKKIYKPPNNNLRTSSNTSRSNQDNSPRINRGTREADWKDDTDDEFDNQELEAHYMYMAHIQEVTPVIVDNSGPIFDAEPLQKVQNDDDNYNVFDDNQEYPEQPESVNEPYPGMCYDREQDAQDDIDELAQERDLLASLIEKLKCKIDYSKNCNKYLEISNKALID
nr:hypothetical protein [Tanacetum cinerariifolium]